MRLRLAPIVLLALAPRISWAEAPADDGWVTGTGTFELPPNLSPEFLDPAAKTRFHLTAGLTPTETDILLAFEVQAALRLGSHVGLTAALPFGADLAKASTLRSDEIFLGNVRLGVEGGGMVWRGGGAQHPEFSVGGAIDIYAPTAPAEARAEGPIAAVLTTRPLEPGLFLSHAMAFRARLHLGFDVSIVGISAELGGTPAFTIEQDPDLYGWLTASLRARVVPISFLEPFIELGGTVVLGQPALPRFSPGGFVFTPGVRFHFLGVSPAVFANIYGGPSGRGSVVTIGIDLAGAVQRKVARAGDL